MKKMAKKKEASSGSLGLEAGISQRMQSSSINLGGGSGDAGINMGGFGSFMQSGGGLGTQTQSKLKAASPTKRTKKISKKAVPVLPRKGKMKVGNVTVIVNIGREKEKDYETT